MAFGLPEFAVHRSILLMACLIGVIQYGVVSVFGVVVDDFVPYYGLGHDAGNDLYAAMSFGACALSFIAGLSYDFLGATYTMALGTLLGALPLIAELDWSTLFPSMATLTGLKISFLLFGTAESFFNTVSTFAPLEAFSKRDLGKVSAFVQVSMSLGVTIQSEVYSVLKTNCEHFVTAYYTYMVVCTI